MSFSLLSHKNVKIEKWASQGCFDIDTITVISVLLFLVGKYLSFSVALLLSSRWRWASSLDSGVNGHGFSQNSFSLSSASVWALELDSGFWWVPFWFSESNLCEIIITVKAYQRKNAQVWFKADNPIFLRYTTVCSYSQKFLQNKLYYEEFSVNVAFQEPSKNFSKGSFGVNKYKTCV